jgi:sugar lactone lactonase YvrE
MKTFRSLITLQAAIILILFSAFIITSCSDDDTSAVKPEVLSVSPTSGTKTTVVTINGKNFSSSLTENEVTFNGKPATITAATSTQLTVTVPASADSGPVIVTTKGSSATNQPVFTFHWLVNTLAGTSQGYVDGFAAKFNAPSGIAADAQGNLIITDFGNSVIRKITPAGLVSTYAGSTVGLQNGPVSTARFYWPNGSAVDKDGNVFISEEATCLVRKITALGIVSTLAGGDPGFADGAGASAKFRNPSGIAIDTLGNVYVADQFNHRIRKITPGGVVSTFAGGAQGSKDGTGTEAQFFRPVGLVVDANGNVFVVDLYNHRIRKITPSGVVTTIAGSSGGFADGSGTAAQFAFPAGLALDKQGNLYVADTENQRIRKITPLGVVSTFAGIGTQGTADGLASTAQFFLPREIDIDADGNVYIVEAGGHRVRKID